MRGEIVLIIIFIMSSILGEFLSKFYIGRIISLILFLIIVGFVVYYFGFSKLSNFSGSQNILYEEYSKAPFNFLIFLLVLFGVAFLAFFSYRSYLNGEKILSIILAAVFLLGLFALLKLSFFRSVHILFNEVGIVLDNKIITYENIEKVSFEKNTIKLYPKGQKFFGTEYFVTPLELVILDKEKVKQILGSRLKNSITR